MRSHQEGTHFNRTQWQKPDIRGKRICFYVLLEGNQIARGFRRVKGHRVGRMRLLGVGTECPLLWHSYRPIHQIIGAIYFISKHWLLKTKQKLNWTHWEKAPNSGKSQNIRIQTGLNHGKVKKSVFGKLNIWLSSGSVFFFFEGGVFGFLLFLS